MDWNKLSVGNRVCAPGSTASCRLDLFPFGLFLMVRLNEPSGAVIRDYANGQIRCRAIMVDGYLVFLHQCGMGTWKRSVFHIAKAQHKHIPAASSKIGLPLHIILVDAQTGILKAKRVIQLDSQLALKIVFLMASQDKNDPLANYDIQIRRIRQRYSDSQLVALSTLRWRAERK